MPKPKQKPKPDNRDIEAVLNSSGWPKIIKHLENCHPIFTALGISATTEQRAAHQIRCQEYQFFLTWFKSWTPAKTVTSLPSEYKDEPK